MPIKKKGGMGRVGQCPLRNLVAWALPIGQWALNGHLPNTNLPIFQRGRKQILDGGTQLNNKNLIFAKISSFSIFNSIKSPKDGGT